MKKNVKLPLYDEFLEIFDNHQINNWRARHFWEKIQYKKPYNTKFYKGQMYAGLKVLLECKYLEIDEEKSTKTSFSYKETPRLNELRDMVKKQKLERIFNSKKIELLDQIKDKENNIKFIKSLLEGDKTLDKYFINHKKEIESEIKNIKSNIILMDDILNLKL
ncbi:hypothetical protein [Acinetobacter venetianus]|uniref:hypothetical protein n=1 Tax=Acinetobacter venetianus TaxID=52133 RepID=UPI00384BABFF